VPPEFRDRLNAGGFADTWLFYSPLLEFRARFEAAASLDSSGNIHPDLCTS
jgi:hypothetical protein